MKKNHNTAIIAAVAVFSIALLAGCRELPGKEAADQQLEQQLSGNFQQEAAEAVKQSIGKATVTIGDAVQTTTDFIEDKINTEGISREFTTSLPAGSASAFKLDNVVGEITLVPASGDEIVVTATVIVHERSVNDAATQILDHAEVSIEHKDDVLTVTTHGEDSPKKNLWDWSKKEYGHSDLSINYVVELPDTVGHVEINNNVGSTQLRGLQGTFDIASNVGSIILQDTVVTGKSSVKSNTGSIELGISGMDNGSSLKATSDIGKISADLASSVQCTVEANSELGHIAGAASGKQQDYNGGGPLVSLTTQIGAISVNN
ncbi:hypothetical protein [Paenibacillus borealis]|uniref:Adhesin domain-containing protein n=1 Tax=Paenibacillus borealis TaxID=160799 RepID=A0A089LCM2_PAEBO|nr:hypothetical protein [Paenibacillus borealis]AIQ59251.1 hypothetical protein PBOR_21620 [Paenibacillus borealis]